MIKINNYELSLCILEELIKRGIRKNIFNFDGSFEENELFEITNLNLTGLTSLKDINKLARLKSLSIYSFPTSNMTQYDVAKINQIEDFTPISLLTNLEELRIANDNYITELNISSLKKLRVLELYNNLNLKNVIGIDSLTTLESISLINNKITDLGNTKKYIINTMDAPVNILDIKLFSHLFKDEETRKFLEQHLRKAFSNITFGEKTTFDDGKYIFTYEQAKDMYYRALRILRHLEIKQANFEAIKKIHAYIAFSIKYNDQGLAYRNKIYFEISRKNDKQANYLLRRLKLMNTSYAAIVNKEAICEGYVNMMIFLLDIIGIEARMVNCSFEGVEFNHAAIKFKYNGIWYYADPERERLTKQIDEFGYTLEEFSRLYSIPIKEYIEQNKRERGRL